MVYRKRPSQPVLVRLSRLSDGEEGAWRLEIWDNRPARSKRTAPFLIKMSNDDFCHFIRSGDLSLIAERE